MPFALLPSISTISFVHSFVRSFITWNGNDGRDSSAIELFIRHPSGGRPVRGVSMWMEWNSMLRCNMGGIGWVWVAGTVVTRPQSIAGDIKNEEVVAVTAVRATSTGRAIDVKWNGSAFKYLELQIVNISNSNEVKDFITPIKLVNIYDRSMFVNSHWCLMVNRWRFLNGRSLNFLILCRYTVRIRIHCVNCWTQNLSLASFLFEASELNEIENITYKRKIKLIIVQLSAAPSWCAVTVCYINAQYITLHVS